MNTRPTELGGAIHDNRDALLQVCEILKAIDAAVYTKRVQFCFGSSIGGHVRHVVDHYTSLEEGLRSGLVDYESRARDIRIENDPVCALGRIRVVLEQMSGWCGRAGNPKVRVRSESCGDGDTACWLDSSALREFEHVLSHTIHHFALIAVICATAGIPVPEDFGVAPSTLRFRRRRAETAA